MSTAAICHFVNFQTVYPLSHTHLKFFLQIRKKKSDKSFIGKLSETPL